MSDALAAVRRYHQDTKHRPDAYAPGPGFLDWDSQPDPFRRYAGAPLVALPLVDGAGRRRYGELHAAPAGVRGSSAAPGLADLGLFLELALGLSAWKSTGAERWALRNNPSSGNLHPTEGYLLLWQSDLPDLVPGLYHYAPEQHALERRAVLRADAAATLARALPGAFGALGLSSILWREAWKDGARAYRYCQHDVGHALGATRFAAGVLGWGLRVDPRPGDDGVAACLGLDRDQDLGEAEAEHPDLLAPIGPGVGGPGMRWEGASPWETAAQGLSDWRGRANALSRERVRWPQIGRVLPALHKPPLPGPAQPAGTESPLDSGPAPVPDPELATTSTPELTPEPTPGPDACALIRARRSAQRLDALKSYLSWGHFERALSRTLPRPDHGPFDVFPFPPAIDLLLFVHAVEGLEPGLYLLDRVPGRLAALRAACAQPGLEWAPVGRGPLPLHRLAAPLDLRATASKLSCFQGIAGHGALSLGMLADSARVLDTEGPWAYRRLYWEAGLIGQVLYLEAEACGLRGTGIGCYFDDVVHGQLGLDTSAGAPWQDLYHFTIGAPVEDRRLGTEPAYAHLGDRPRI